MDATAGRPGFHRFKLRLIRDTTRKRAVGNLSGQSPTEVLSDPVRRVEAEIGVFDSGPATALDRSSAVTPSTAAGTADRTLDSDRPTDARNHHPDIRYNRLFAISDVFAIVLSLVLAALILGLLGRHVDPGRVMVTASLMLPVWFVIAYIAGLYSLVDLRISHSLADEIGRVVIAVTAWSWLLLVVRTPLTDGPIPMAGPILRWVLAIPLMLAARAGIRAYARRRMWHKQPVAVVGQRAEIDSLNQRIDRHPDWGLEVEADFSLEGWADHPAAFADAVKRTGVERVLITGGVEDHAARTRVVNELVERDLMVDIISGGPETLYSNAVLHGLEGLPVLSVRPSRLRPIDLRIKRAFDIFTSGIGLILTAPVIAWAAVRIKLDSPGPVFFRQERAGYRGEKFQMLKLRTMVNGADRMRADLREATADNGNGDVLFKLEDDPRITRCGRSLRKWSIDELPQLWNVFVGDMSMVGPRPLPLDEARQASGLFAARTRLRPGIAGPWQALGRSRIPFADMIRLDYSYVTGWSMAEDLRLLVRTALAALQRTGAH